MLPKPEGNLTSPRYKDKVSSQTAVRFVHPSQKKAAQKKAAAVAAAKPQPAKSKPPTNTTSPSSSPRVVRNHSSNSSGLEIGLDDEVTQPTSARKGIFKQLISMATPRLNAATTVSEDPTGNKSP